MERNYLGWYPQPSASLIHLSPSIKTSGLCLYFCNAFSTKSCACCTSIGGLIFSKISS